MSDTPPATSPRKSRSSSSIANVSQSQPSTNTVNTNVDKGPDPPSESRPEHRPEPNPPKPRIQPHPSSDGSLASARVPSKQDPTPTNALKTTKPEPKQSQVQSQTQNPTPAQTPAATDSSSGIFKVPKKILVSDNKELNLRLNSISVSSSNLNSPNETINPTSGSASVPPASISTINSNTNINNNTAQAASASTGNIPITAPQPTRLNKTTITNLNKSLKAKQKIINSKEPHPKNTTLISEIINASPQSSVFPNNISAVTEADDTPNNANKDINTTANPANSNPSVSNGTTNPHPHQLSTVNLSLLNTPNVTIQNSANPAGQSSQITTPTSNIDGLDLGTLKETTNPPNKGTHKRIAKQSSTRTDFFAAKLASAVDDIESSDSDETFVYENNNLNDIETMSNAANMANDNNSIHGSVINGAPRGASPLDTTTNNDNYPVINSPNIQATESVHSFHSSKHHKIPTSTTTNRPPSLANSFNSNHYLDSVMANGSSKDKRLNYQRSFSSYSNQDTQKPPIGSERSSIHQSPLSPYHEPAHPSVGPGGLGILGYHHRPRSQRTHSINDGYNEEHYSYDEIDDDDENLMDDDISTDGEFYSERMPTSSNTTMQQISRPKAVDSSPNESTVGPIGSILGGEEHLEEDYGQGDHNAVQSSDQGPLSGNGHLPPFVSKASSKKYKSSTSSSKLRSTTSKLFDKKGSQPRRYSIIPDDIDIEDFDDELIYYDNNIRFPYSNPNNPNESTSLLNQNHRLPHYRSLNLNFPNMKKPSGVKSKRYVSSGGQALLSNSNNNSNENTPPRPPQNEYVGYSPYPDQQQYHYYDFDEYDEENAPPEHLLKKSSRKFGGAGGNINGSGRYNHPRLSPSSNRFMLPRKSSNEDFRNHKANCLKSFIYTLISILVILMIGFIMGFVLATTKDLTNVSITSIESPVVSQDELIFNIVVEALNPGWFTVTIDEVELELFAKSGYLSEFLTLPEEIEDSELQLSNAVSSVETVLIGRVYKLESSITFNGGFFNRDPIDQTAEIKLLSPGKNLTDVVNNSKHNETGNPDNSKKWEVISKNPFDLIVKGVLKYSLPMSKGNKAVLVDKVQYIDPNSAGYKKSIN